MRVLTFEEMDLVSGGTKDGCKRNNGWGNGDDDAPGNSLNNNKAENDVRPGAAHKTWGTAANPEANGDCCSCGTPPPPAAPAARFLRRPAQYKSHPLKATLGWLFAGRRRV
jgi:hypothetical protein